MKAGLIVAGIILLVIGSGGYLYLYSYPSEAKTLLGQLDRSMIPNLPQYLQILTYKVGSMIIASTGLVVLVWGAVAKKDARKRQVQKADIPATWSPSSNRIFCRYCGKLRPIWGTLCSACGKPTQSICNLTRKCVHCRASMTEDSGFCSSCGKTL